MPPATSWTVDDALAQLLTAINKGTFRLKLDEPTKVVLLRRFRADFEREFRNGTDWPRESVKVLALARAVGTYSEQCTISSPSNPLKALASGHLDQSCVLKSAEFVAKFICPTVSGGLVIYGKWCRGFRRVKPSRLGSKLANAAKTLSKGSRKAKDGAPATKRTTSKVRKAR